MARRKGTPASEKQKAAGAANRDAWNARRKNRPKVDGPSRHKQLIRGELKISDLDDEEVRKGRGRNRNGDFAGRAGAIPAKLAQELQRENMRRFYAILAEGLMPAAKVLKEIAESGAHDKDRLKAAQILFERAAGKVPDVVRIGHEDPWEQILGGILNDEDLKSAAKSPRARKNKKDEAKTE